MLADLRYALRGLTRSPGFALAAILTLALGIGAATAIFSVADRVLLRPLPYADAERLIVVWDQLTKLGLDRFPLSIATYREYSALSGAFESTAGFAQRSWNLTGAGDPEQIQALEVTPNLLAMLGVQPSLGRAFGGEKNTALLSHALFLRRFGGDARAIGKSIALDGRAYEIIGVLPADFEFSLGRSADVWTTIDLGANPRWGTLNMLARLRPGLTIQGAQSALDAAARHYDETAHPYRGPNGEDAGYRVKAVLLRDQLFGEFRTATLLLLGAVAAVLLIACVNVANLLLARATARQRETRMRRALGASLWRLARQWLTEAGVLALLGGAGGVVLAGWGVEVLARLSPIDLPPVAKLAIDARVLLFAFAISAGVAIIFGLAPTLPASARKGRSANLLVTAEAALAVFLLAGAGLLAESFNRLRSVDAGFNAEQVLTMRIDLPPQRYQEPARRVQFFADLRDRLAAMPGVTAASFVSRLPVPPGAVNRQGGNPFSIEGRPWNPNAPVLQIAHTQTVGLDYFRTLEIPVLEGRVFTSADVAEAPRVTVVNATLARAFFPQGAIGRRILLGAPQPNARWMTIVGIVSDVKTGALDENALPQFYTPHAQDPGGFMSLAIRTRASDPLSLAREAAAMVRLLDRDQPVYDVRSMEQRVAASIGRPRFQTVVAGFFAAAALLLAAIGIFAVVAQATARRTREIGIRMAIGADHTRVIREVLGDGLKPVLIGAAIGLAGALALGRILATLLFRTSPYDPRVLAAAAAVLIAVATVACILPARRAARIDPANALRTE